MMDFEKLIENQIHVLSRVHKANANTNRQLGHISTELNRILKLINELVTVDPRKRKAVGELCRRLTTIGDRLIEINGVNREIGIIVNTALVMIDQDQAEEKHNMVRVRLTRKKEKKV